MLFARAAGLLALALSWALPAAAELDPCRAAQPVSIAVLPGAGGRVLVSLEVNRTPAIFELDTGSDRSLMDPALARQLSLSPQRAIQPLLVGADGRALTEYVAIRSVGIASLARANAIFVVPPQWSVVDPRARGMIGGDILRDWDILLDLGGGKVQFYPPSHCLGMSAPFEQGADTVPINTLLGHIIVTVTLDGQRLRALLDTGASDSSMSLDAASRFFGLAPGRGGVIESGTTITTDGGRLASWSYQFHQLEIGRIRLMSPVVDLVARSASRHVAADHDMVLGLRELRQLRLYIAYGRNKLSIARPSY